MGWLRVTKWKVVAIIVIVLFALFIDGFAWISRVTAERTSTVQSSPKPTETTFAVVAGQGAAFAAGMKVEVGDQPNSIRSISGDLITLTQALDPAPAAGTSVTQSLGFAGLSHPLTSNPSLLGYQVYVHKGLDIVGGSELTIAICQRYNVPAGAGCRNGPLYGTSVATAQQETVPVLQNRVNSLGVSEATVQPEGTDLIEVELPGVPLQQAESVVGTTAQLHFAIAASGSPPAAAATNPNYCGQHPANSFCVDQENLYQPSQLSNSSALPERLPLEDRQQDPGVVDRERQRRHRPEWSAGGGHHLQLLGWQRVEQDHQHRLRRDRGQPAEPDRDLPGQPGHQRPRGHRR